MSQVLQGDYLLFATLIIFPILVLIIKHFKSSRSSPLPPGPALWPVSGSSRRDLMGSMPLHVGLANLAKIYGPLMSVRQRLDARCLLVASSPEVAREILKTNDRIFCGRYVRQSLPKEELSEASIAWQEECTDQWKLLRSVCRKKLFSNNAMENQAKTVQEKITKLVSFLRDRQGEAFNIKDLVYATVSNIIANALMSTEFISLEEYNEDGGLKYELREYVRVSTARNTAGFNPVPSKDLEGARRKVRDSFKRMEALFEPVITERRSKRRMAGSFSHQDLLDALLNIDFSNIHISVLFTELCTGADNITAAIEWSLAELIRNPECVSKIRAEIGRESKEDFLKDFNSMEVPYLEACVKETMRLHPPAAYTIPHTALETCQVMNYAVPKNTLALVNIWAIGRDPSSWEEPLKFKPERFLERSDFDFNGKNLEFLPFGSGRRICPAMPMATKIIPLIVATLIHFFDSSLPNASDPTELNMEEESGITTRMKHPLILLCQARKA